MVIEDHFANITTGFLDRTLLSVNTAMPSYLPPNLLWGWLTKADSLGGSALSVGLIALRLDSLAKSKGRDTKVGYDCGHEFDLGRSAVNDALGRLHSGGLIDLEKLAGRKAVICVRRFGDQEVVTGKKIPWSWLCKAAKAPTPALIVGLAAWRYANKKSNEAHFSVSPLEGSARSTRSLRRGSRDLEKFGLLEILPAAPNLIRVKLKPGV